MPQIPERAPADPEHAAAPVPTRGRRATSAPPNRTFNSIEIRAFPGWARQPDATVDPAAATFAAGAGLTLFDQMLRAGPDGAKPPYAGVLRQRLALKAAASCARLARLREDENALRNAEHLSAAGADRLIASIKAGLLSSAAVKSLHSSGS